MVRARWTGEQLQRLLDMREGEVVVPWPEIDAAFPDHSLASCKTAYYAIRTRPERDEIKPGLRPYAGQRRLVPGTEVAPPRGERGGSGLMPLARLMVDADLRARIESCGVTAGLLGDPAPGRSALDRMRADQAEAVSHGDHRVGPKPTLAGRGGP